MLNDDNARGPYDDNDLGMLARVAGPMSSSCSSSLPNSCSPRRRDGVARLNEVHVQPRRGDPCARCLYNCRSVNAATPVELFRLDIVVNKVTKHEMWEGEPNR